MCQAYTVTGGKERRAVDKQAEQQKRRKRRLRALRSFLFRLIALALVVYVLFFHVVGLTVMSSGDMSPRLDAGDMLLFYRIPGLAADLALCIYVVIFLYIISLLKVTLTLTGIAGIVLSIGMAVDANVIIFERIKEELRLGKSPITSVNSGFSIAFRTVLDANVTTIIAALALFFFGSGTIRGFALTLMIGVAVSMFTAVVVTKRLILAIVNIFGGSSLNFGKKEAA